jgi:hypothetical protein
MLPFFTRAAAVAFVAFSLLQSGPAFSQATDLQITGDSSRRVDLVIVGDGYTSGELGKFAADVTNFLAGVFAQEPFKEYKNYFNVRRIDVASAESGADHPERNPPVLKNTAFDATYNCSGIQRLICVSTAKVLMTVGILPPSQRDLILVIVNDTEYGGSGGSVAVASTNASAVELILHETGHTLAFLADEYTAQPPACFDSVEPTEANATKETNRNAIKWRAWIAASTPVPTTGTTLGIPGLYLGSKYCPTTLYRPTYDSKMRTLGRSYDQINTEQFIKRFYEFARPIETQLPVPTTIALIQGQTQNFAITIPIPATHALNVTWQLDGLQVGFGLAYSLSTAGLALGNHTLTVTVVDTTAMVRNDPLPLLFQQQTWSITLTSAKRVRAQITSQ